MNPTPADPDAGGPCPWREAMTTALYGDAGFYRPASTPAGHFRTAAHLGAPWVRAIGELVLRVDRALDQPDEITVVDLGAGGGELIGGLAHMLPERIRLVGVDVAERPTDLPADVEWRPVMPERFVGLLVAVEWLDVMPLDVARLGDDGVSRVLLVDADGSETDGPPLGDADLAWQQRWWPLAEPGDRAEIGRSRDEAWADAVAHIAQGLAVAVDYPAVPARDLGGTLTGYRAGRPCLPVPDGSCDLTAHVLFESLVQPDDQLISQRDALRRLGVSGHRPAYSGDPAGYLRELSAAGDAAELLDPAGLGGFTWLLHPAGITPPL